jgi:Fe-Mn family superoxide dismutase
MTGLGSKQDAGGMTRREMIGAAALGCAVVAGSSLGLRRIAAAAPGRATVALPPLPYAGTALQPHLSQKTLELHHGKHHKAYVDNTLKLIKGTPLEALPLEEIVRRTAGKAEQAGLFNNAAQSWNHAFYWQSLKPKAAPPSGALLERLRRDLGGLAGAKKELVQAGLTQFASGWAWLVLDGGKLKVVKTPNADTPLVRAQTPLLTIDVWEHAYYLDYQNRRGDYLQAVVDHLLAWDFAAANLKAAKK